MNLEIVKQGGFLGGAQGHKELSSLLMSRTIVFVDLTKTVVLYGTKVGLRLIFS